MIARLCTRGSEFTWTRDSTALIVPLPRSGLDTDPPCRLSVLKISTGKIERFLALGQSPAVSPDGKTMAFVRHREVRLLPLPPSPANREVVVVREPRAVGNPIWTKDGAALVYSLWGECREAHRVEARANAVPTKIEGLPEGLRLSDAASNGEAVIAEVQEDQVTRYKLDLQAAEPKFVAERTSREDESPRVRSPVGSRIAYSACSMGATQILTAGADGSGARVLVNRQSAPLSDPMWTPDGRTIAFTTQPGSLVGHGDSSESLWVVPASGGKPRSLLPTFYAAHDPWWSADSQIMYFSGAKDDRKPFPEYLWSVRVSDSRLTQLTTRECGRAHPSPDGQAIFCGYYYHVPHLYRVSPTGQEGPELPGIVEGSNLLVGSRYLYLLSKSTLFRYDPENGSSQRIGSAPRDSWLERLSPDERYLTVKVRSMEKSRIVLVGGLR